MSEEDKLLELAEKATPGRWVATDNADVVGFLGSGAVIDIAHVNPFEEMLHAQAYANAAFIAACSPETIRALVEGKRELEAVLSEALEGRRQLALHDGCDWPPSGGWPEKAIAALTKNGVSA